MDYNNFVNPRYESVYPVGLRMEKKKVAVTNKRVIVFEEFKKSYIYRDIPLDHITSVEYIANKKKIWKIIVGVILVVIGIVMLAKSEGYSTYYGYYTDYTLITMGIIALAVGAVFIILFFIVKITLAFYSYAEDPLISIQIKDRSFKNKIMRLIQDIYFIRDSQPLRVVSVKPMSTPNVNRRPSPTNPPNVGTAPIPPIPNANYQPNTNVNYQPNTNVNYQPNTNVNYQPNPNVNYSDSYNYNAKNTNSPGMVPSPETNVKDKDITPITIKKKPEKIAPKIKQEEKLAGYELPENIAKENDDDIIKEIDNILETPDESSSDAEDIWGSNEGGKERIFEEDGEAETEKETKDDTEDDNDFDFGF
ncbi:MAG: hypothetical protein ACTSU2_06990 [Promethearchaeota archaeon]